MRDSCAQRAARLRGRRDTCRACGSLLSRHWERLAIAIRSRYSIPTPNSEQPATHRLAPRQESTRRASHRAQGALRDPAGRSIDQSAPRCSRACRSRTVRLTRGAIRLCRRLAGPAAIVLVAGCCGVQSPPEVDTCVERREATCAGSDVRPRARPAKGTRRAPSASVVIEDCLAHLTRAQMADGSWVALRAADGEVASPQDEDVPALDEIGSTALCTMAFLRVYKTQGQSGECVRRGLKFLLSNQDEKGAFRRPGGSPSTVSHAIATIAMCLAAGRLSAQYRPSAIRALQYAASVRGDGGWPSSDCAGDDDSLVATTWTLIAFQAAEESELEGYRFLDADARDEVREWLVTRSVSSVRFARSASTRAVNHDDFPWDLTPGGASAARLLALKLCHTPDADAIVREDVAACVRHAQSLDRDGPTDYPFIYFGSLALFGESNDVWWDQWVPQALHGALWADWERSGGARVSGEGGTADKSDYAGGVFAIAMTACASQNLLRYRPVEFRARPDDR